MADSATYTASWLHAVEAFNKGDLAAFGEVIADDCVFKGIGDNKAEILKTIRRTAMKAGNHITQSASSRQATSWPAFTRTASLTAAPSPRPVLVASTRTAR